jgi:hypothetical protein
MSSRSLSTVGVPREEDRQHPSLRPRRLLETILRAVGKGLGPAPPHMLGKLKSRGSQGFNIGLPVANMHLPGMRRVGVLHVQFLLPALLLLTIENKDMLSFREDLLAGLWPFRPRSTPRRLAAPQTPVGLLLCRSLRATRKKSLPAPTTPCAPALKRRRRSDTACRTTLPCGRFLPPTPSVGVQRV